MLFLISNPTLLKHSSSAALCPRAPRSAAALGQQLVQLQGEVHQGMAPAEHGAPGKENRGANTKVIWGWIYFPAQLFGLVVGCHVLTVGRSCGVSEVGAGFWQLPMPRGHSNVCPCQSHHLHLAGSAAVGDVSLVRTKWAQSTPIPSAAGKSTVTATQRKGDFKIV